MHHHHLAPLLGLWISLFFSMAGGGFAIFIAIRDEKRRGPKRFDFAASARRIRTMPIRAGARI